MAKGPRGPLEIKGIVRPPYEMPDELKAKHAQRNIVAEAKTPLLVTFFIWLCFLRAAAYLVFGLIEGLAPDSAIAAYIADHFDALSREISPEIIFYICAALYGYIGWRWYRRDWRARWITMFMSGAVSIRTMVLLAADHAAGKPLIALTTSQFVVMGAGIALNLLLCGYLAFYPGMEQAFSETGD